MTDTVSHPEYYKIQRWIGMLTNVLNGKAEVDDLRGLQNVRKISYD
jgi:hypothetical protein